MVDDLGNSSIEAHWEKNKNWEEIKNNINYEDLENEENEIELSEKSYLSIEETLKLSHMPSTNQSQFWDNKKIYKQLEDLLILYPKINPEIEEEDDFNSINLKEFQKKNLNQKLEDNLYLKSSPEILLNYNRIQEEEKNYEFYKNLECQNFIDSQKERKYILNNNNFTNDNKLEFINQKFFINNSFILNNDDTILQMKNSYIINQLLNKYSFQELKDMDSEKILFYFNEIKDNIIEHKINIESLGILYFNNIENYLLLIIEIISNKIDSKNKNNLEKFIKIYLELFDNFKSSKLYFFILKFIKNNQQVVENIFFEYELNYKLSIFNFEQIYNNNNYYIFDFKNHFQNNYDFKFDFREYWTLISERYLFLFIKKSFAIFSPDSLLFYFTINIYENKLINFGKIKLIDNKEEEKEEIIKDINLSIRKKFIYIFYIIQSEIKNNVKYYLKVKIYNSSPIAFLKEDIIEIEESFIPEKIINDSKFIYCFSNSERVLILKKNYSLSFREYSNFSIKLEEKGIKNKINNLNLFRMYNSLSIQNLIILESSNLNKIYIGKIFKNQNNYFLEINEAINYNIPNEKSKLTKIAYNNKCLIITKLNTAKKELLFSFSKNKSSIVKGFFLFPFNSNNYNYEYSNDIYEILLQNYSYFLNLFGNYDLIKTKSKEIINLLYFFVYIFNENNFNFIIKNIIENNNYNKIKLYYIIILKHIISFLYNNNNLDENLLKDIFPFFKNLILNGIKEKNNKIYYKIFKEIIEIISYINDNILFEIKEIKHLFEDNNEDINYKFKLLLIQLLLEQKKTQRDLELYKIIINIEKNFLNNIFQKFDDNKFIIEGIQYYYLSKNLMINASEKLFKLYNSKELEHFNDLLNIFQILSENILVILELYEKILINKNSNLDKFNLINDSFIFRSFYFIIEKIISNKKFIINNNILHNILILLDRLNINDICYDFFDMDNLIEIKSPMIINTDNKNSKNDIQIPIKLKEPKDIVIKTSLSSYDDLNEFINIKLINNDDDVYVCNLNYDNEIVFENIKKINVSVLKKDSSYLKDFIINIMPLKNKDEYYLQKNNKNKKILLLIQKAILQYLLFLFKDIHKKIDEFNDNDLISKLSKLYQKEIFKFISIPDNIDSYLKNKPKENKIIDLYNNLVENIGEILNEKNINFTSLINSFENINKNIIKNSIYKKEINKLNILNTNKIIKQNIPSSNNYKKYDLLFTYFKKYQSKKNKILSIYPTNEILDLLIKKMFLISIKYYNYFNELDLLLFNLKENQELEIEQLNNIHKFALFYSIYEEACNIKKIFNSDKKKINNENYEEELKNLNDFYKDFILIIDFLYDIIIPSENDIQPDNIIVNNILELIENKNFEIIEFKKYCEIKNIICGIKLVELLIINNLLLTLKNETNISFLLYLICGKIRKSQNKSYSFFDKTNGADYFVLEKLKHQFQLMLCYLSMKYIENENIYSNTTKISLIESLMWKIRGRNFPILKQILRVFEKLKKIKAENNGTFILKHNNIFNIKNFNENRKNQILFNVFQILSYQIIGKIKNIITSNQTNSKSLMLTRDFSNISNIDYRDVLNYILLYFSDLNQDNQYYYELILFFYKNLVNCPNFLNYILLNDRKAIKKILNIALNEEESSLKVFQIRQLLINLLIQIINNIKTIDELYLLSERYTDDYRNSFNSLYDQIYFQAKKNNQYKFIFNKLLLIFLNKLYEIQGNDEQINEFFNNHLNNLDSFIFLLFNNIEKEFALKSEEHKYFEEDSLFSKEIEEEKIKKVHLFGNAFSQFSSKNSSDNEDIYFDENINLNCYYKFIITDEILNSKLFSISNLEEKPNGDILTINDDNFYLKLFIKNFSKPIINIIISEIKKGILNEKGIYLVVLIISKLINYINKEEALIILNFLFKFQKLIDNSPFISYELIDALLDYFKDEKEFYKKNNEIDNNKYLPFYYDYIIEKNSFGIRLKNYCTITWYKQCLINPIFNINDNIKKLYDETHKVSNLSFYKASNSFSYESINENSILFTESINCHNDLLSLDKIIKDKNIKIIITKTFNFNDVFNIEISEFINKNSIFIYIIENNLYNIFIDYFIKGKGEILQIDNQIQQYIKFLKEYNNEKKNDNNQINKNNDLITSQTDEFEFFNLNILFETEENNDCLNTFEINRNEKINEIKMINHLYELATIKLAKRVIYDIICLNLINNDNNIINHENIKFLKDNSCVGNIQIDENKNILDNLKLVKIFGNLCIEYYFNINLFKLDKNVIKKEYFNNILLKNKLKNYLLKISNVETNKKDDKNEWLEFFFKEIYEFKNDNNKIDYNNYLSSYDLSKLKSEPLLYSFYGISYDILLFFSKNCDCFSKNGFPISIFFGILEKRINHIIEDEKGMTYNFYLDDCYFGKEDNKHLKNENNYELLYIFEIMNNLYDYYIKINNDNNYVLFKEYFISSEIHLKMRFLIDNYIDLKRYFYNRNKMGNLKNCNMIKSEISLLIQFVFKYIDFCLILFLKGKDTLNLFENFINEMKDIYTFYQNYKLLSIEKYYKKSDYKEMFSLIAYITDSINNFKYDDNNENYIYKIKINDDEIIIKEKLNEYIINNCEDNIFNISIIEKSKNISEKYNLIVFLNFDINNNYHIIDIIDVNDFIINGNTYELRINKEMEIILIYPLKEFPINIYSFEDSIHKLILVNNPSQYSWNISFGEDEFLLLSNEDNNIYSTKGKEDFILDENINKFIKENNKQKLNFIGEETNKVSFYSNQNGEIFYIGKNEPNYKWLNLECSNKLSFNNINIKPKILFMSASCNNSFIIDNNSQLYGIGDNTYHQILKENINEIKEWTNIPLPENSKKFLKCANGEDYLLCIVEDANGKKNIYSKGNNSKSQCGLENKGNNNIIDTLSKCNFNDINNLDFKSIYANKYFSCSITKNGEMYIWGEILLTSIGLFKSNEGITIKKPHLVYNNSNIFVEMVSLNCNNSEYPVLVIGKILKNNTWYKKLFHLEKSHSLFSVDYQFFLNDALLVNPENKYSRLIPFKIALGDNKAFISCMDENKLSEEIIKNNPQSDKKQLDIRDLKSFYNSNKINEFINLLTQIKNSNIIKFIEVFEPLMKEKEKQNSNFTYKEFILYLKSQKNSEELYKLFKKNGNGGEVIFKYIIKKLQIVIENYMKYYETNLLSKYKIFLQKAITNNSIYLRNEIRKNIFTFLIEDFRSNSYCNIVKIDRFKAYYFYEKFSENNEKIPDIEFKETLFGQLFHSLENLNNKDYVLPKNRRLFEVKFIYGERSIDQGGPYHELFSNICKELLSPYLDLFIKTPNSKNEYGMMIEKYIVNPDSNYIIHQKAYEFLGKLMICALSSGETLNLNIHPIFWKKLLSYEITFNDYENIDINDFKLIENLENLLNSNDNNEIMRYNLKFVVKNLNGRDIELIPNGNKIDVNINNVKEYIELFKSQKINEFNNQIEYIKRGFYSVIPCDIMQILYWNELEELVCGKNIFDINDFRNHTSYRNGYNGDEQVIKWFWEWIETTTEENRFKYLKYVSGRSRLPTPSFDYGYKHTICKKYIDLGIKEENNYPYSHTCYFTLDLPNYNSKEILFEKMNYVLEKSGNDIVDE